MTIMDPADGSLDFGETSFSFGLWVKVDQSAGPWDMPLFKGGSNAGAAGSDPGKPWAPIFGSIVVGLVAAGFVGLISLFLRRFRRGEVAA